VASSFRLRFSPARYGVVVVVSARRNRPELASSPLGSISLSLLLLVVSWGPQGHAVVFVSIVVVVSARVVSRSPELSRKEMESLLLLRSSFGAGSISIVGLRPSFFFLAGMVRVRLFFLFSDGSTKGGVVGAVRQVLLCWML